ncbi:MAG: class 1 fructose-bisphosphatase, partial [Candidatus Electrothrix sp. AW2]|nr:class 1 fructose-bisphosphatase [Candidatus Electrothrix gigas]
DITIPHKASYYSINEAYSRYWYDEARDYITKLKEMDEQGERSYSLRYIGSLVSDFHRNLVKGGVFLYPRDKKNTDKPDGKLRLLYEAAPLAMIAEEAGGLAITDDGRRILDIEPTDLHQRVPLVIGSRDEVTLAGEYFKK